LVYTGGEPLVRPDIFELLKHSQQAGLANIIATNGTLIDEEMAFKLKDHGVVCNAISIDAANPDIHDMVRNKPGSFDLALRAIEATKKAGILLQINTTAMEYNMSHLPQLIDFADGCGAGIMLMYQLVAVGRGEKIEKATLKKTANKYLSELIALKQKTAHTIIEPVAGPQYWPYILEKNGIRDGLMLKLAGFFFHGCAAGRGFAVVASEVKSLAEATRQATHQIGETVKDLDGQVGSLIGRSAKPSSYRRAMAWRRAVFLSSLSSWTKPMAAAMSVMRKL